VLGVDESTVREDKKVDAGNPAPEPEGANADANATQLDAGNPAPL
jgi:hypothetical protein